jgi:hypothetical protein
MDLRDDVARHPYASCVDAAEMMPDAQREAVVAAVSTPARAEDQMVVGELPPRRADRDRAAPAVARENGIAVARLCLPPALHVQEQSRRRKVGETTMDVK